MRTFRRRRKLQANADPGAVRQAPWTPARRRFAPVDVVSADELHAIHTATLTVLRDTGVHFMSARARTFLGAIHGVAVDAATGIVRFEPEVVEAALATVPATFTVHARNPAHDIRIGGDALSYTNVITPPYVSDLDAGKRSGNEHEFRELLKLCQRLNTVSFVYGYPVEPQDLAPETRHLDAYLAHIELTDKAWRGYTLGDDRIVDAIEMARIARQVPPGDVASEPGFIANVTTNSPLRIDGPMGDGLMLMARANQPVSITSFAMAGAIAPITLAGATVLQNAEILAAVVLSQNVRAGAPVAYGSFTANVYMRTGAIAFGGPDLNKATLLGGQLARHYRMPFKAAVTTGAKSLDAQAGYETQGALWTAVMSGASIVSHACGFMESALTVSREKMVIDSELVQMMSATMAPIATDADALAVDAIAEVGPGGQYFEIDHTLARYRTEYYEPLVSDWESLENWQESGGLSSGERANRIWKQLVREYETPALGAEVREELRAYVARRREAIARGIPPEVEYLQ